MKLSFNAGAFVKRFSYGNQVHPSRDWFYLLAAALLLVAVSVGWNAWLLQEVERDGTKESDTLTESFDAAPIESVRAVFESRRVEEIRYRTEYQFVDPSR